MAQINTCLKWIFTIFNVFIALIGAAVILITLSSQVVTNVDGENVEGRTTGLVALYALGAITLMISVLGAYGAQKESKACLIVFLVCMVFGCMAMLRTGVPAAAVRPQLERLLEEKFRILLPLDKAAPKVQYMAESLQSQLHCCGLFSYSDWEDAIPTSCLCSPEEEQPDTCQAVNHWMLESKSVYAKTCFPIISYYVLLVADILIGVVFTLAALALLGMTLSSIMIYQLRRPSGPNVLMTVPAMFTSAPPKYQELQNPPCYEYK